MTPSNNQPTREQIVASIKEEYCAASVKGLAPWPGGDARYIVLQIASALTAAESERDGLKEELGLVSEQRDMIATTADGLKAELARVNSDYMADKKLVADSLSQIAALTEKLARASKCLDCGGEMVPGPAVDWKSRAEAAEKKLADFQSSWDFVMSENCVGDEKHCTCVPALKGVAKSLESKLKELDGVP